MIRFAVLTVVALAACGKGDSKDGKSGKPGLVERWTDYKTRMCACTDKACSEKVFDEYRTWATSGETPDDKMDKALVDSMEKLQGEFHACRDKLKAGN